MTGFEGFIDFLSAQWNDRVAEALTLVIVLNSVSLTDRAISTIQANHFNLVSLYLDRDDAGNRIGAHFRKQLKADIGIRDLSDRYTGYKDFNEFLVKTTAELRS